MKKKREKKDRSWAWELVDFAELIFHVILFIPRTIFRIAKDIN